jgi:hypothetical protein
MSYYIGSFGRSAKLTIYDASGRQLSEVTASKRGLEPYTQVPHKQGEPTPYPAYEVLTANEITEIIEHKRMEPIFYINDDPAVRAMVLGESEKRP